MKEKNGKKIKRVKIHRNLRISVIVVITLFIIVSAYSTYAAYQEPTITEQEIPTCIYTHTGQYDYRVYLKNNTIYDNASVLLPGQETYFKKIVDHINASYTYRFNADKPATVQGTYTLIEEVQTNLWSKDFEKIPKTSFSSNINYSTFTINFPINTTYYEEFVNDINEEIGATAQDLVLNIKCTVLLSANTANGSIYETFSPSIQIPLGKNTVEIQGELLSSETGMLETTIEVNHPEVLSQRTNMAIALILFSLVLIGFVGFTATEIESRSALERQMGKIRKKYSEWIVEVEKPPKGALGVETVLVKSLEDLIKTSEELGKPVVCYAPKSNPEYIFYVFDESLQYKYILSNNEKVKKSLFKKK